MKKSLLVLLIICIVSGISLANDLSPSTEQRWEFLTNSNPAAPEVLDNPYGDVEAYIDVAGLATAPVWNDGIWSGTSVRFTADIPNTNNTSPGSYKDMFVEICFKGNLSLGLVTADGVGYEPWQREITTYGDGWTLISDHYFIEPNPTSEMVCYALGDYLGNEQQLNFVEINTICVPEPVTICMLGLGGILISRRKRQ